MVKMGGGGGDQFFSRGDHLFQLQNGGTKCFRGGPIFTENIGPPGPFFPEIFGPGGLILGGPILTSNSLQMYLTF